MPTPFSDLSDAQLEELLRLALAPEPPSHHVEMLLTGYDLRHVDDLVAAITHDSAAAAAPGVRTGGVAVRELAFAHDDVTIDAELSGDALVGQVIGAVVAEVVLESPESTRTAAVDEHGRFRFEEVAPGPARLALEVEGRRVVTAWALL